MLYHPEITLPAWVSVAALCVVIAATCVAVLSNVYDDSLGQRTALAIVGMSAVTRAAIIWDDARTPAEEAGLYVGLALYGTTTIVKVWRRWRRAGRPGHPFRRSTDWGELPETGPGAQIVPLHAAQAAERRRSAEVAR